MNTDNRWIFFSPHFDDAALSCGGLIARLKELNYDSGIITVFTEGLKKKENLSDIILQYVAEDMGCNLTDVNFEICNQLVRLRKKEDEEACKLLGIDSLLLGYQDAIYRGGSTPYYSTEESLFSKVDEKDLKNLLECLVEDFTQEVFRNDILFFPNAVGNHVDHQVVKLAASRLIDLGYNVNYYNEFPYILNNQSCILSKLIQTTIDVSRFLIIKNETIKCYKSQLAGLFGEVKDIKKQFYANSTEYYWCNYDVRTRLLNL